MLLSQDVILDSSSARQMITELVRSNGIVFPTMYNRDTNQVFSKGGSVNKISGSIKLSTSSTLKNPEWADGSCLVFTNELFNSIDGFYEKFFMYFEDVDFCYRAKSKGFTLKHVDIKVSQTPKGPSPLLRSRITSCDKSIKILKSLLIAFFRATFAPAAKPLFSSNLVI